MKLEIIYNNQQMSVVADSACTIFYRPIGVESWVNAGAVSAGSGMTITLDYDRQFVLMGFDGVTMAGPYLVAVTPREPQADDWLYGDRLNTAIAIVAERGSELLWVNSSDTVVCRGILGKAEQIYQDDKGRDKVQRDLRIIRHIEHGAIGMEVGQVVKAAGYEWTIVELISSDDIWCVLGLARLINKQVQAETTIKRFGD